MDQKAESDQQNFAQVMKPETKINKKKTLKQTQTSANLLWYRFKIREGSPKNGRLRRLVMSFNTGVKCRGGIDGESEVGDCDEVCVQDEVNQKESEQNEVDGTKKEADFTGKMYI